MFHQVPSHQLLRRVVRAGRKGMQRQARRFYRAHHQDNGAIRPHGKRLPHAVHEDIDAGNGDVRGIEARYTPDFSLMWIASGLPTALAGNLPALRDDARAPFHLPPRCVVCAR
jgi:hypothetical protein